MCPKCKAPLIVLELQGVEIDHCLTCGGTWLDAGELEQICALAGAPPGPLAEALRQAPDGERSEARCPRCRAKMRLVRVGEADPVTLDRCPKGHGLWFDQGEVARVIRQFGSNQGEGDAGALASFFGEIFRHETN
jgi:Zn-finger nucleic acid-binding protein